MGATVAMEATVVIGRLAWLEEATAMAEDTGRRTEKRTPNLSDMQR